MKKKFIITVDTEWCGMKNQFGAFAEDESELWEVADRLAFENFHEYAGIGYIANELFPDVGESDLTVDQWDEIAEVETEYYSSNIREVEDDNDAELFDNLEIVYGNEEEEIAEEN